MHKNLLLALPDKLQLIKKTNEIRKQIFLCNRLSDKNDSVNDVRPSGYRYEIKPPHKQ